MKWLAISFLCVVTASAKDPAIREFILDERTVYSIPVSFHRVTTISFPGPISAIDAALITADPKKAGLFQLGHAKGSSFFSVRALTNAAMSNINVRWNKRTYVLELYSSDKPFLSVIFQHPPEKTGPVVRVSPSRLLALLDKAKSYRILKQYHFDAVAQVEYRSYAKEPRILDCKEYEIQIKEAFRFDPEDTLVFYVMLRNRMDVPLHFAPNGFSLRVGDRTYPQSISDASGVIPPDAAVPAYFAVTGTPNGGRNDISLKNDFFVILEAKPEQAHEPTEHD